MLFDFNNTNNSSSNSTNHHTTTPNTTSSTIVSVNEATTISGPLSDYLSPRLHVIHPQAESSVQLGARLKDWGNPHFPTVHHPTLLPLIYPITHIPYSS